VRLDGDLVADADEDEAEEEAGQHGVGPVAAAEPLHEQHGRDGAEHEGAAADERHEDAGLVVEADLAHQHAHVVEDGVDAGELAQEDHDVRVDDGPARARVGEEVQPRPPAGVVPLRLVLRADRLDHAEELLLGVRRREPADALPHGVRLHRAVPVHEPAGALREEDHADEEDGGEDEGGAEDVAPVALDADEDGRDGVAQHLAQRDVELVQRDQVAAQPAGDALGDVDGDGAALEADARAQDEAAGEHHAEVDGAGLQRGAHGVEDAGHDDGPAPAQGLVGGRQDQGAGDRAQRHAGVDQAGVAVGEMQRRGHEEVGAADQRLVEAGQQPAERREGDEDVGEGARAREGHLERRPPELLQARLEALELRVHGGLVEGGGLLAVDVIHLDGRPARVVALGVGHGVRSEGR